MLLEGNDDILKTAIQKIPLIRSERIGYHIDTDEFVTYVVEISRESRPVLTGKERVTSHGIIVWRAENRSFKNPPATARQFPRLAELLKRECIVGMHVSGEIIQIVMTFSNGVHTLLCVPGVRCRLPRIRQEIYSRSGMHILGLYAYRGKAGDGFA